LNLWIGLNEHLVRVLSQIPEEKRNTPVRVGVEELIRRYVEHCEVLVGKFCRGCERLTQEKAAEACASAARFDFRSRVS